jgi:hypothetical protein
MTTRKIQVVNLLLLNLNLNVIVSGWSSNDYLSNHLDLVVANSIGARNWWKDLSLIGFVLLQAKADVWDFIINIIVVIAPEIWHNRHTREPRSSKPLPYRPTMAEPLRTHLSALLQSRAHPKTLCPSEVARALTPTELETCGATNWRDLMPAIRVIAWEMRARGELEILQRGEVLGMEVGVEDVRGPVRVRRVQHNSHEEA